MGNQLAVLPPFTPITWPVMKLALLEARNTIASAISSGLPARLTGTPAISPAFLSGVPVNSGQRTGDEYDWGIHV